MYIHVFAYFNLWSIFLEITITPASQFYGNCSGILNNEILHGCYFNSCYVGWNSGLIVITPVSVQCNNCVSVNAVNCLLFLVILVLKRYYVPYYLFVKYLYFIWCGICIILNNVNSNSVT